MTLRRPVAAAVLCALLGWQAVVSVTAGVEELAARPLAARLQALTLDADTRRARNLGEHEALYRALVRHLDGSEPKLVLWFPPARPDRLYEPEMLVLADHLRALLFPVFVRQFSASRPAAPGVEVALDESWFLVDLTAGETAPWAARFEPLATGPGWTLMRHRGEP
jgi:hypothetical protein